ncbi:MAG: YafY family transcriptional regulator [Clostridia bacterium]|nr:YafY family transcriptional regulator [Clostridia bacterium]
MKIDRLVGILMLLINKEKITARVLAEHFQVSVRTIQRDIDTLTLAGIPIYADVGSAGGYQLMSDYKIDKSFINKNEANILTQFLKSLEQVAPYSEVKSISNKFLNFSDQDQDMKLAIHLNPGLDSELFKKHMNILSKARDELLKVTMVYYNIDFSKSTRTICPHTILLYGNNWYIYAYCELREDFRMFKLHRIVDCQLTHEHFALKPLPDLLPWQVHFDHREATEPIILEIDKKLQGKLPDYFGPEVCQIHEDKIIVTVYFPIDEWVYSLLMSLVPHIKVIAPQSLKDEFIRRLKICLDKNNYDI